MKKQLQTLMIVSASVVAMPLFADTTLQQIAPENSIILIGVKNVEHSIKQFKETKFWSLWESESMNDFRKELLEGYTKAVDEMVEELGVDKDALTMPTGAGGLAVYLTRDPDIGTMIPAALWFADYGDNADKTEELITAALEQGEKENHLEYETLEVDGNDVYTVTLKEPEDDELEFDDMRMGGGMDGGLGGMLPIPDAEQLFEQFKTFHFARTENAFVFATGMEDLLNAMDAMKEASDKMVGSRDDFQAVLNHLEKPDAYAMILTRDLMQLITSNQEMAMMAMMAAPTLKAALGDIQGIGFGGKFNTPSAMMEERFAIYMPNEKKGITALAVTENRADLPNFVGPEAVSYSLWNLNFEGTMDLVRGIFNSNPMFAMQGPQVLEEMQPVVTELTAQLGPDVHAVTLAARPFKSETVHQLLAIRCRSAEKFENAFAEHVAGKTGAEPRDFLGYRIYTIPIQQLMMSMMPMPMGDGGEETVLGIGGGFVFIGQSSAVEQALRTAGKENLPSLDEEQAFTQACGPLTDGEVVAWGYTSLVDQMELQELQMQDANKQMIEQMKQWDPEMAEQMAKDFEQDDSSNFDFNLMRQYLGPMSWQVRSIEDGFVGTVFLHGADDDDE